MKFTFHYLDKSFNIYIDSNVDLAALYEVFVAEEYSWDAVNDPKIIIDLGAHFGDTTLYYHLKYPEAMIYALEPAPDTFNKLCINVSKIKNIIPVNIGIADKNGIVVLNLSKSSLGHSLVKRDPFSEVVDIEVATLLSFFERFKIKSADLIKFDIEGAEEFLIIDNCPEKYTKAYIGEVHADLMSISSDQFLSLFKGFSVEKIFLSNKRFIMKALKTD